MDQVRWESCDPSTVVVKALSTEEVMVHCGNWLGCINFDTENEPAIIYYKHGYPETLEHEMDHCIAGGTFHESDLSFGFDPLGD